MDFGNVLTAMVTPFKKDGSVDYAQAEKLAVKIDKLLYNREEAVKMGKRGNDIYKEKFTPAAHLKSLQAYIKVIIKGSKL